MPVRGYLRHMQDLSPGRPATEVRRQRQALGLSQQTLATRAGVSLRTLARIEQGEDARLATLASIASALGTTTAELLAPSDTEAAS